MTVDSVAQCPNEQETKTYDSKTKFFRDSGAGVMAIMPNVKSQKEAKSEYKYVAFKKSGTYKLEGNIAQKNDFWFVNNHRLGDSTSDDLSSHTYIGVMIAKVLLHQDNLAYPLHLRRNEKWFDLEDNKSLSSFRGQSSSTATEFMKIQHKKDLELFKDKFGDWHALANKEPRLSSWEQRKEWSDYNLDCLKQISNSNNLTDSNILVEARLMKFQPTNMDNPEKPVAWKVQLGEAEAVYIKTFSPISPDFVKEYYISFAR